VALREDFSGHLGSSLPVVTRKALHSRISLGLGTIHPSEAAVLKGPLSFSPNNQTKGKPIMNIKNNLIISLKI
jgi:hypothetical protein